MIQLRNPQELGGMPLLFSALSSLIGSYAVAYFYSTHYEGDAKLSDDALKTILASLSALWVISVIAFFSVMKKEYIRTFYSIETTSDFNKNWFLSQGEDQDEEKSLELSLHPEVYATWGDDIIKPWTLENWSRWEEERPAWFTDKWIEGVPNRFVPYDYRVKYKKTKGRVDDNQLKRRRGSISVREILGGVEEK
ncbi:hypothetical protein TrST_g955 [Triparma strigata]|uniref:Uncharacterized protein n=2 Tax=Triparma strigata TaxID=1606541 RepID=A0A9W7BLK8_9STRA|nr:hypothetical protein TrST_g955 [Triparma strigata]